MKKMYRWLLVFMTAMVFCVGAVACGSESASDESQTGANQEEENLTAATSPVVGVWETRGDMTSIIDEMISDSITEKNVAFDYDDFTVNSNSYVESWLYIYLNLNEDGTWEVQFDEECTRMSIRYYLGNLWMEDATTSYITSKGGNSVIDSESYYTEFGYENGEEYFRDLFYGSDDTSENHIYEYVTNAFSVQSGVYQYEEEKLWLAEKTEDIADDNYFVCAIDGGNMTLADSSGENELFLDEDGNACEVILTKDNSADNSDSSEPQTAKESGNVLMAYSSDEGVFGNEEVDPETIITLTFLDTLSDIGENAWDVSANGGGSVMAWTEVNSDYSNEDTGLYYYNLYIAGEGGVDAPETCAWLFSYIENELYESPYSYLLEINFNGCFYTGNTTSMKNMFSGCSYLTELDLSSFETSNVTDMSGMFIGCTNLTELNLSSFNTSNVTDMSFMFGSMERKNLGIYGVYGGGCASLETLDLSGFDTSNVTNMKAMFCGCNSLRKLDLSNFDTSKVTDMSYMFCVYGDIVDLTGQYTWQSISWDLKELTISSFDTSNVTDMSYMFACCGTVKKLDVSNFDTSNVTDMSYMFAFCGTVKELDISGFDMSEVTAADRMFYDCSALEKINLSNQDMSGITDISCFFYGCSHLTEITMDNLNISNVTNMEDMFSGCVELTELSIDDLDTSKVTNMGGMFSGCSSLTDISLKSLDTSNVEDMASMFSGCTSLNELDLSNFDTSSVTDMRYMFYNCRNLNNLNICSFDTSKVTNMSGMFEYCKTLESLDIANFDTSSVTIMAYMFYHCSSLTELNLSNFVTTNVESMDYMFCGCSALNKLDVTSFTTNRCSKKSMFRNCGSLKEVDLSSFTMYYDDTYIFKGTSLAMETTGLENWNNDWE